MCRVLALGSRFPSLESSEAPGQCRGQGTAAGSGAAALDRSQCEGAKVKPLCCRPVLELCAEQRALEGQVWALDVEERLICGGGSPAGSRGSSPSPGCSEWRNVPVVRSCSPRSAALPSLPDVPGCATPVPSSHRVPCVGSSLSWTWGWEGGPSPAAWDPPVPLLSWRCNPARSRLLLAPERAFRSCRLYLSHPVRCLWSHPTPSLWWD